MCLIISSIIIITIIIIFHFYDAPVLIRELKIAWFCVFPINCHRNFPCDMIIPTCSLCQTWANPSAVEFQRIISSVRKSWKRKFCDFLFTFWSHQMGNKSFSYPSKSCSDSKQMLRDLFDLSRDVFGLLRWKNLKRLKSPSDLFVTLFQC